MIAGHTFLYCTDADVSSEPSFQLPGMQMFEAFQHMSLGKNNLAWLCIYMYVLTTISCTFTKVDIQLP